MRAIRQEFGMANSAGGRRVLARGLAALAAAAVLWAGPAQAREAAPGPGPATVHSETLLQSSSSWDGVPYKGYPDGPPEMTVLKLTIPANFELPWHTHPMPNAAYVLSGRLTVQKKATGEQKVLNAGDVLPEMVDELHRGFTGDQPVELIVFYAGTRGMPLSHR